MEFALGKIKFNLWTQRILILEHLLKCTSLVLVSANPNTFFQIFLWMPREINSPTIMALPNTTWLEKKFEILEKHMKKILKPILDLGTPFNLVELGAGDGQKTKSYFVIYKNRSRLNHLLPALIFQQTVLKNLIDDLEDDFSRPPVYCNRKSYRGALTREGLGKWENKHWFSLWGKSW